MNMATLWSLPVIYVCENNLYGEYTPNREVTAGRIIDRPAAFGMKAVEVDGQDVRLVFMTMQQLVARARRGEGPAFLQCNTYRYFGHHVGDINPYYYRSKEEEMEWKTNRDAIRLLSGWLSSEFGFEARVFKDIDARAAAEVAAGVDFALNAPFPDPHEVNTHVYA